jgi:hypothetical protein
MVCSVLPSRDREGAVPFSRDIIPFLPCRSPPDAPAVAGSYKNEIGVSEDAIEEEAFVRHGHVRSL